MAERSFDLWFDPNTVDSNLAVDCWISNGPRALDERFDPQPGDRVTVGDGDEPPLIATVISREGDRVSLRIEVAAGRPAVA